MSLYLKYRPQDFGSVVGQTHVVQTLENTLKQNKLSHAYLFCGPRGTGKTSLARIVAKSLNCTARLSDSAEPCHSCEICSAIHQGRLVDLIEIDAASNRGIDEIRELRDKIVFTPTQAKAKIYIIDEVHMLTKEAFNALLKTLEEPPEHAYFILATTEAHKIPETIVSRCQQFTFKRIEIQDIVTRLQHICEKEGFKAEEKALFLVAKAAHGGLRDAIGLLEQMASGGNIDYQSTAEQLGVSGHVVMEGFAEALLQKNPLAAIELLHQIHAQGKALSAFLEEWVGHLRELMLAHLDQPQQVHRFMEWIDIFNVAKQQLSQAIIPQLPIEMAIIRACDFKRKEAKEEGLKPEEQKKTSPISEKKTLPQHIQEPVQKKTESTPAQERSIFPSPIEIKQEEPMQIKRKEEVTLKPFSFSLELVQSKWAELVSAIEIPFIKMSFMDGEPVKVEEGELYLEFNSRTLMEKIQSSANQAIVIRAFEQTFQAKPLLKFEVKKISLSPKIQKSTKEVDNELKQDGSIIEMAQEIFGMMP